MKINYCPSSRTFTLSGLFVQQLAVLFAVLRTADHRCFTARSDNGCWYSDNDFVLSLTDQERADLASIVSRLETYRPQ